MARGHGGGTGAAMPLLQHRTPATGKLPSKDLEYDTLKPPPALSPASSSGSTAMSSPTRARLASEELIVPAVDSVHSVYYGVDSFSPTLVDFTTADHKRIVWSSRAHRKMMMTLHRAWLGQEWKPVSMGYWSAVLGSAAFTLMLVGFMGEILAHHDPPSAVHLLVDAPLLVGAMSLVLAHTLSYFEVINSCHNLEIWLDEYFHGYEPVLHRRFVGWFPTRIDFWSSTMGIVGALLYVLARCVVLLRDDQTADFGVISVSRLEPALIFGYWVPMFFGSFLLLVSAYLAHVEVVHRWFSWRLDRLETWVTALTLLASLGLFASSTLQFVDPMSVLMSFPVCIAPFGIGCVIGLCANFMGLLELEAIHKRHKHPEYGLLKPATTATTGYGTWDNTV